MLVTLCPLFRVQSAPDTVDWTPRLRQSVKLHFAVRCRSIVGRLMFGSIAPAGEAEAGSAGEQPARNNQLETHRADEAGAVAARPLRCFSCHHRTIDFPMPQKTHLASCAPAATGMGRDDCRRSNSAGGQ